MAFSKNAKSRQNYEHVFSYDDVISDANQLIRRLRKQGPLQRERNFFAIMQKNKIKTQSHKKSNIAESLITMAFFQA